ncbi:hypothetical protein CGRA01v4_06396 [Colletotrichum graminicola]|uniref:Uncharacterized protein n=1 Tax=Colletotrichum graminicola (strain M1.001 / M2 / FGSC 10212) TaxID=645133 RepID=E3Q2F3_COLGM|nr:uncharacterized protein GLRG_00398 [Colletotrichum graminicola M1.001]EFQ25254.1 hypothetical protein GLRG_00398 [Colletotrichum graminicola M1.001]WDK15115.1 hypothetical protein CGRA01v4_06396 [Colletotrichum graminicola]
MANNGPTIKIETGAQGSEAWDEERLELALDQLKLLHIKLRGLRTTIPIMLEPLSTKHSSPQVEFDSFMESVATAKRKVQDFQDLRKSDEMTKIMDHVAQRRKEEPNGIKAWRTIDHPEWTMPTPTTTTTTTEES